MDECKPLVVGAEEEARLSKACTERMRCADLHEFADHLRQGLTLVHFSAQSEPCLPQLPLNSPSTPPLYHRKRLR